MRFVSHFNCPVDWEVTVQTSHDKFGFLDPNRQESNDCENFVAFNPPAIGVDWRTSLAGAKQNRYYKLAEEAALELWNDIKQADTDQQGALPKTFKKRDKQFEVINTAIDCAINLYSSCDPEKIQVVTKSLMLLFLHDGMFHFGC
jgi:hypothetical protein